jgi:hypothetical protein
MNEIALYIQIFVTAACTLAYIFTYKYQASKLKTIEQTVITLTDLISGQSKIISDFEKYKSLFDIEDFEKRLKLKLDNQKDELEISFKKQSVIIADQSLKLALKTFQNENEKMLKGWEELTQIAINITLEQFPTKADKPKRDEFIQKHYSQNASFFIRFIDDYLDGKAKLDKQL